MNHDPFTPQYGVEAQQPVQTPKQYGGLPVGTPKSRMNGLLIPFILSILLLLGALGFGMWAFTGMQDYKNNSDEKSAKAVTLAEQKLSSEKDKEFLEKEKSPFKSYQGPQASGSISFQYPKTWSAFVTESDDNSTPVDGYFHPNYVPGIQSGTDFALRVRVLSKQYADELKQYESKVKNNKVSIVPYKAPKLPATVVGSRITGEVNPGQQDTLVLFPLRDKTIEISTQSTQFAGDFDSIIMANFTFVP